MATARVRGVEAEDEGVSLGQAQKLNFTGAGVTAAVDGGDPTQVNVDIPMPASGGDNVSVNGAAATDADFDDATPAAPASAVNVKWQKDASTPTNISAYLGLAALATLLNSSITEATSDITTTSATDVVATGTSVTPAAGTYLVWLAGSFESSNASAVMFASIYMAGVQVAASEREIDAPGSNESSDFTCIARVTVNGAQAIDGRWRTTAGTATMHERQVMLLRVA